MCPMSLLSLTVHWLDTYSTPRSAALQVKNFPGSHNSDRISAAIKGIVREFGHRNSFPSEPVRFHSVFLVAKIACAMLVQVEGIFIFIFSLICSIRDK